ncbi:hypothetical protein MMC22_004096 [Lobaria immixta]|nr:hypothetical protein [Lobaria immixta]
MDSTSNSQANTSVVSSRREKRKSTRAATKNMNFNNVTYGSASAQQSPLDAEGPSNRKTQMINEGLEYRSGNLWLPATYYDDIRTRLFAESPQGTHDVPRKQGKKRAGKRALDEATSRQPNEVEQQRLRKLKAQKIETVGAAPFPALVNPAPRSPRLAKRREWAANIDPALLHVGSPGDASVPFVGSARDSDPFDNAWNGSNGISGLGRVDSPRQQQSEAPKPQMQLYNSAEREFEREQGSVASAFSNGQAEQAPIYPPSSAAQI